MEYPKALVGKTITAVYLADDKQAIKFDILINDNIVALCEGDCCSHTWIENVENPGALIGSEVLEAVDLELPQERKLEDSGRDELVQYYGLRIRTTKGDCVIDYRNESNGYYGGNLSWPGESCYQGVFNQNASKQVWKQLA